MKNILLAASFFLTLLGCSKKEPIGYKEFANLAYQQTLCSDPWITGSSDSITVINVRNYLTDQNVFIQGVSIKQTSAGEICQACTCKTGKTIYVSTFNSPTLIKQLTDIGFVKQ